MGKGTAPPGPSGFPCLQVLLFPIVLQVPSEKRWGTVEQGKTKAVSKLKLPEAVALYSL